MPNSTILYLHSENDFIAIIERYTRKIISLAQPFATKGEGEGIERAFKLDEGEAYLLYENGNRDYFYIQDEELIPF